MRLPTSLPLVVGVFAVLPYTTLLLTDDLVLRENVYSDYASFQLPVHEFAQDEFAAGRFPHWIPWIGCGIPLHATAQAGLCYPLLTPLLFLLRANAALKLTLFAHVVLCYAGQYRLGRLLGLSAGAASLAGLIATQCGFLTGHLMAGHISLVFAYALLPWLFMSIISVCDSASLRSGCGFTIVAAGLLLAGHPQVPYYGFLFGGLWIFASLVCGRASAHRLRAVVVFAVATVTAILLAAVQLLPTLELVGDGIADSSRGTADYANTYSLDALDLCRLVIPTLKGNPMVDVPEFAPPDFYHEKACYLGIVTWLLACAGLFRSYHSRWPWGVAALVILSFVIALGRKTFLFDVIGTSIPGLFLFRCPGRCLSMAAVFVSLLAGRGFDSLRISRPPIAGALRYSVGAGLIFVSVNSSVLIARELSSSETERWLEFADTHLMFEVEASYLALLAAAACLWWPRRPRARVAALLTAGLLVVDLGYFNVRCIQFELRRVERPPGHVLAARDEYRFIESPQFRQYYRDEVRYSKLISLATQFHLRMVGTNEGGVLPGACEELFAAIERDPSTAQSAASCRFIATRKDGIEWTELDLPPPRIRFIPGANVSELKENIDSDRQEQNGAEVDVIADGPQSIQVEVGSADDGVLVVSDTWFPGWTCHVDGTQTQISRVLGSFRGVQLTPGKHAVVFRYDPASFRLGSVLSLLGGALLLLLWALKPRGVRTIRREPELSSPCRTDSRQRRA